MLDPLLNFSYNPTNPGYGAPTYGAGGGYNNGGGLYYQPPYSGFEQDLELLVRLGQAALIVFMILAVVAVIYMLAMCCLGCGVFGNRRAQDEYEEPYPQKTSSYNGRSGGGGGQSNNGRGTELRIISCMF